MDKVLPSGQLFAQRKPAMQKCGLFCWLKGLDAVLQQEILHRSMKDDPMAFYSIKSPAIAGSIFARIGAALMRERSAVRTGLARRRVYRATFSELSSLSARDLADIGIDRYDIHRLAMEESMKVNTH